MYWRTHREPVEPVPEVWRQIRGYCCVITADCQIPRKEICIQQEKRDTEDSERETESRNWGSSWGRGGGEGGIITQSKNNVGRLAQQRRWTPPIMCLFFTRQPRRGKSKTARLREGDKWKNADCEAAGKRLGVGEEIEPRGGVDGALSSWCRAVQKSSGIQQLQLSGRLSDANLLKRLC